MTEAAALELSHAGVSADGAGMRCGPFYLDGLALRWERTPSPAELWDAWLFYYMLFNRSGWACIDLVMLADELGEDYSQLFEGPAGVARGTFYNWRALYRAFPPERRRWNLPRSYYQAVLPLEPDQQEAVLDWAVAEDATRDDVRAQARALRKLPAPPEEEEGPVALFRGVGRVSANYGTQTVFLWEDEGPDLDDGVRVEVIIMRCPGEPQRP